MPSDTEGDVTTPSYIIGIDTGSKTSGWLQMRISDGSIIWSYPAHENAILLLDLCEFNPDRSVLVIEDIKLWRGCGESVKQTVEMIGRCDQAWPRTMHRIYRKDVKKALARALAVKYGPCGTVINDKSVRLAMIALYSGQLYGGKAKAIGTKDKPGPLYGVTSHAWAALALAYVYWMQLKDRREQKCVTFS